MNLPLETNDCLLNKMLRRNFFKAILSSSLWMTSLFAQANFQIHGRFNYDLGYQLFQENNADQPVADSLRTAPIDQLSLLHLDLKYAVKEKLDVHIRLGHDSDPSENFWDDKLFYTPPESMGQFLSAYADFSLSENVHFKAGLVPLHVLNATLYNPRNLLIDNALNQIVSLNSQKLGMSIAASLHPISFQVSLWNQTNAQPIAEISGTSVSNLSSFSELTPTWVNTVILSSDYRERMFKLGYSAALAFVPSEYDEIGSSFTAGLLISPLNQPYVVATLGATEENTSVGLSLYDYFSSYHGNYLAYWKNTVLNLALEYDHMALKDSSLLGSASYVGATVFQSDPIAVSYSALLSYTFAQKGDYKIDHLSGRFSQKPVGLTIGCGFGSKTQKDVFALISVIGQNDWLSSTYTGVSGANRLDDEPWVSATQSDHMYRLISVDNTIPSGQTVPYATKGSLNAHGDLDHTFQIKSKSLTFILNYQFNELMEWKNELTYTDHQKIIFGQDYADQSQKQAAYLSSINWNKTATFRSQLSVFF